MAMGSKGGAVVRALASHRCGPGSNPGIDSIMSVEFVVGSLPFSDRCFAGYTAFHLSLKTNNSNSIWNARTRFDKSLRTP